jgi:hypothetical protein
LVGILIEGLYIMPRVKKTVPPPAEVLIESLADSKVLLNILNPDSIDGSFSDFTPRPSLLNSVNSKTTFHVGDKSVFEDMHNEIIQLYSLLADIRELCARIDGKTRYAHPVLKPSSTDAVVAPSAPKAPRKKAVKKIPPLQLAQKALDDRFSQLFDEYYHWDDAGELTTDADEFMRLVEESKRSIEVQYGLETGALVKAKFE